MSGDTQVALIGAIWIVAYVCCSVFREWRRGGGAS